MMLKKIRRTLAFIMLVFATLLFLDFTGTVHAFLGWVAKIQFVPAVLAGSAAVIVAIVALTLILGRVYCSVVCPLGILQDLIAWMGKKAKKNRYAFSPVRTLVRMSFLVAFLITTGGVVSHLLEPYSAFGRIISNLLQPLWLWGNNFLAYLAERADSYAFYETDVWMRSATTLSVAVVTLILIAVFAWRGGRTYCNTICPVGTILGILARYSWLKPVIDTDKCNGCRLCERNCKGACIDAQNHTIDYSRCVVCMDCVARCKRGAISYARPSKVVVAPKADEKPTSESRRAFLVGSLTLAASATVQAQKKKVDGGLAVIQDKVAPERQTPILPPGAQNDRHFRQACTACQLCVSVCPNHVLRPSNDLSRLMQPEMSFERGYCRPECTKCSEVCPTGAICKLSREEKSSTQVGHAVWIKENCLAFTRGERCDNCARHCPAGAIQMVEHPDAKKGRKIPVVDAERCIGCGACENLCPARPFSAMCVEGHKTQKTI